MTELANPIGQMGLGSDHFEQHHDVYGDIFLALGAKLTDTDTHERAVAVSQEWIRGDYGHDDGLPVNLNQNEKRSLRMLCVDGLGMGAAVHLPSGDYDKLMLFGASQFGNVRRAEAMADLLTSSEHTFGRAVLLGGERPLYPSEVPGFGRLLNNETVLAAAETDEWLARLRTRFQSHFPDGVDTGKTDLAVFESFGETPQMRVSMIKAFGSMALSSQKIEINKSTGQTVGVQEFELTKAGVRATLLHCPPQQRKNGPPRHTTESCTGDDVNIVGVKAQARIAFIGAQPHLVRMPMTVARAFAEAGQPDVGVWASGPELDKGTPVEIVVSEVSKLLYESWLSQQPLASRA